MSIRSIPATGASAARTSRSMVSRGGQDEAECDDAALDGEVAHHVERDDVAVQFRIVHGLQRGHYRVLVDQTGILTCCPPFWPFGARGNFRAGLNVL